MYKNKPLINTYLRRISNTLLINGGYLDNIGLYSGDMGLVLFFYHYARLTQNEIYSEYSAKLLEKIQNKIQPNTSVDYKKGLSGIGSTIEYLAQNNYLEVDTDVILEEFDKRIFFTFNLPYLSIDKIADIVYYALWRLSGNSTQKDTIIESVMPQIEHMMKERQINQNTISPTVSFFKDVILKRDFQSLYDQSIISKWFQLSRKYNSNDSEDAKSYAFLLKKFSKNDLTTKDTLDFGFQNGLTSLGLYLMSELDCDDSWLSLFPNNIIFYKNESISV